MFITIRALHDIQEMRGPSAPASAMDFTCSAPYSRKVSTCSIALMAYRRR